MGGFMNKVQPIRDRYKIFEIDKLLKDKAAKYQIMFQIGIYSGLRISDILKLRVEDVKDKEYITLKETKTRKEKRFKIKKILKASLRAYCTDKEKYEFLIPSNRKIQKAISRGMAYKVINQVGEQAGVVDLGTHTMRKTFGYHFYKQTGDIVTLQQIFNHSSIKITTAYIGIDQDRIDRAMDEFEY
jgi:integrase